MREKEKERIKGVVAAATSSLKSSIFVFPQSGERSARKYFPGREIEGKKGAGAVGGEKYMTTAASFTALGFIVRLVERTWRVSIGQWPLQFTSPSPLHQWPISGWKNPEISGRGELREGIKKKGREYSTYNVVPGGEGISSLKGPTKNTRSNQSCEILTICALFPRALRISCARAYILIPRPSVNFFFIHFSLLSLLLDVRFFRPFVIK